MKRPTHRDVLSWLRKVASEAAMFQDLGLSDSPGDRDAALAVDRVEARVYDEIDRVQAFDDDFARWFAAAYAAADSGDVE